jgi:UDP-N-acetylmuramate--alanine ligase
VVFRSKKRAEVLGIITKTLFCLQLQEHMERPQPQVFGAYLYESGADAFMGGIVENYNSNLIGDGKNVTVVEADEFDRSFCICIPIPVLLRWMLFGYLWDE